MIEKRKQGRLKNLETIISNEWLSDTEKEEIQDIGIDVYSVDQLIHIGKFARNDELEEIKSCDFDSIIAIIYTSGSTGVPKGVLITHTNFVAVNAAIEEREFQISSEDVHISYLPLSHALEYLV